MRIGPQFRKRMAASAAGVTAVGLACVMMALWVFDLRDNTVPATTWVASVCSALAPWKTKVAELTTTASEEIGQAGTPVETQTTLTTLLSGAEEASDEARTRVVDAGIPDVDGGEQAAERFVTALTEARDAYGHAKETIEGLPVGEENTFYDGVSTAFDTLNTEYEASALDLSTVDPATLRDSFDEASECQ